jgi:hypothetical protein
MKKYKVEITEVQSYTLDITAKTQVEAEEIAKQQWQVLCQNGTYHYHETGDPTTELTEVFDVTDTDDPFNSLN